MHATFKLIICRLMFLKQWSKSFRDKDLVARSFEQHVMAVGFGMGPGNHTWAFALTCAQPSTAGAADTFRSGDC